MNYKKTIVSVFVLTALLLSSYAYSQVAENRCDTVKIVAPAYLILNDTSIHLNHDSTAIICNRYIVLTKNNGYSIYSKLVGETKKHPLFNKVFQMLIASGTQDTMLIKKEIMNAEDAYNTYSGKIIRKIKIQVLKPFGPTISDTNLPVISTWGKAINKSHIDTRPIIIERKLLFKVNDTINPFELVENSRDLAALSYLQDATIIVHNSVGDSVDVLVLAKDKFSWMPGINIYDFTHMSVYLKQVNLLGLGQSLGAGVTLNTKSSPVFYLSDVNYYVENIYKQISGAVNFNVSDNDQTYQLVLNRDILPLSVRLGGGLEITQKEENIGIDPTDINQEAWFFKYRYYELWSSYLFYDKEMLKKKMKDHTYVIPGVALYKKEYQYRPFVSIDSNSMFNIYTNLLANIALVRQNYYRTNFLKSFGKAEYIPYGFQFSVTGGYSWAEFMNKPYAGIGIAGNKHFNKLGYIFAEFEIGAHFYDKVEQGAINLNLSYLSNVFKKNRYRYRLLTTVSYTDGLNRFTNDMLYLGEDYGFFGIDDKAWYGKQRLFLEADYITYTPWYFFGFRFAMYGFISAGMLGSDEYSIFRNSIISSIGIGVYMQNDFLAFNSFQMRLAYFPVTPDGVSHFGISFSTIGFLDQLSFLYTKPHIVVYE